MEVGSLYFPRIESLGGVRRSGWRRRGWTSAPAGSRADFLLQTPPNRLVLYVNIPQGTSEGVNNVKKRLVMSNNIH